MSNCDGTRGDAGVSGGGGTTTFTGLTDVPSSYAGQSLQSVRVNSGETALEFYTPTPSNPIEVGTIIQKSGIAPVGLDKSYKV
jgi:hypothetical protein